MKIDSIELPASINQWKLEGGIRRIDRTHIFDYMNGAGELYLAYHFDHLLVAEYKDGEDNDILVELYLMKSSRDAFGLLSLDWGGETVMFDQPIKKKGGYSIMPSSRALYGMGLLRIWSDNLYVRIMAIRETQEARAVILRLGKTITTGRENPSPPDWLQVVKPEMGSAWTLKKDRTAYFYSHLVLNSLYYLSHENILSLNRDTEAVITVFEKNKSAGVPKRIYLLVIRYRDHRQSAAALDGFLCAYLPELKNKPKPIKKKENQDFVQVEDGWMGYRLLNRCLALVFGCPDRESALENMKQADLESF